MKKFFRFLLAAAFLSPAAISCSDDPDPGPTQIETPKEVQTVTESPEGVSLFATDITAYDFNIRTQLGEEVKSYRFDVVSLARYYNDYMEALKKNPQMTEEQFIEYRLVRDDGTGGYNFQVPIDMMWGESVYKQAAITPTLDYVVLAVGCIDEKGNVSGDATKLVVPLAKQELVGDPRAEIGLQSDFRAFKLTYTMNADCSAFYQLAPPSDHVTEAETFFAKLAEQDPSLDANKMMRDLICAFEKDPSDESWETTLDFGYKATPDVEITAMTVALDINGTPNTAWEKKTEKLKEPQNLEPAKYKAEVGEKSATTVYVSFDVDYDVTSAVFFRFYRKEDWVKEVNSKSQQDIAIDMAVQAYGLNHKNKQYWQEVGLAPDTDYVFVSTARNKEINLLEPLPLEFHTKPFIENETDLSKAQVTVEARSYQKTSVTVDYNVPEETACFWERILEQGAKDQKGVDLTDPNNRDKALEFILGVGGNLNDAQTVRTWTWTGLEPDKTYYHFIVGEDMDGRLGNMYVAEYHTAQNIGGPDPKVEITGKVEKYADGSYKWVVQYTINQDVTKLRYCITDMTFDGENMTEEEKISAWTDNVVGDNGMTSVNSTQLDKVVTKYSQAVALAFPYGKDNCLGKLTYLLFDPATIQSSMLHQVRPFRVAAPAAEDKIQRVSAL